MAQYQNAVPHEDTIVKTPITKKQVAFLKTLQTAMNTQPSMTAAEPRFWVIKGHTRTYTDASTHIPGQKHVLIDVCGKPVAEDMPGLAKALVDIIRSEAPNSIATLDSVNDRHAVIHITKRVHFEYNPQKDYTMEMTRDVASMQDAVNLLADLQVTGYRAAVVNLTPWVYPNALFLTHADAERHLREHGDMYDPSAHAYAMTATDSPEVTALWKIIQSVDWDSLHRQKDQQGG